MYEHVSDIHPVHKGGMQPTVPPPLGSGASIPPRRIGKEDVKDKPTGATPAEPTTLQQPPQVIITVEGIQQLCYFIFVFQEEKKKRRFTLRKK